MPTAAVGNFLAATATPTSDATFTLSTPSSYVSVDGGSIDASGTMYVVEGNNASTFTPLVLHDDNVNAFEAANFAVSAVPEPSSVAFLPAGLAAVGLATRKRRVGA
jgi:hypothetical protein